MDSVIAVAFEVFRGQVCWLHGEGDTVEHHIKYDGSQMLLNRGGKMHVKNLYV